jgi:tetratricopeptide (TPR) repeat protein
MALALTGCAELMVNTVASRNVGIKQYTAGQYVEAAGTFRTNLRTNPTDYGSIYFLGACMAKMGAYEQAIAKYKETLVLMDTTLIGRDDRRFRLQCLNSLAEAFVATKDRNVQAVFVANQPVSERQLLLAKINRGCGDADAALEAYSQAALLAPKDFDIAKEYGLYLVQLAQDEKARPELRRAYAMRPTDDQLALALRRVGVVPGPSLKNENDMARPAIPVGPIPEMELQLVFPAAEKSPPRTAQARDE